MPTTSCRPTGWSTTCGEPTPPRAVKRLQVALTRLRRALEPAGLPLVSEAAGYRLRIEPGELDVDGFERSLADGRRALADANPHRAAAILREALALWRGEPFADVAFEAFAQPEIARLKELQIAAIEDRIEADLALGRHHELVAELERLVAEHPLREALRGQLMLALYRSGRQARALEAYRQSRHALAAELGLEPGPALQRLEHAILTSDPALDLPAAPSPDGDLPPVEERKQASILVIDVQWDAAVESEPERLRTAVELLAATATDEIDAAGGSVDTMLADALVASFGAPTGLEDHPRRALVAALAIRERLARLFGDALSLRVGAEAGEVLINGHPSGGPTVTGGAVNLAGRLARQAEPGEIRIGDRIAGAVRGAFELQAHALIGARPQARPPLGELRRTFVGRESELKLLNVTYERVIRASLPHFVTLVGDAGVGKTSLVGAFHDQLAPAPGRWLMGRCRSFGRMNTYRPLGEIVRAAVGLHADDPPEAVAGRLEGRDGLRPLLGLAPESELTPWEAKAQLTQAWIALLEELTEDDAAVVVIEDVHWAENPLLELLAVTAREASGPLLLVATARPELTGRAQPWTEGNRNLSRLWLEPLSRDETELMLDGLTGGLPARVEHAIVQRAEGNPFFVEEVLQSWIDTGVLRRTEHGSTAADLPRRVEMPDTVQGIIAARIDLLPALEKRALQAAAVIGRTFWRAPSASWWVRRRRTSDSSKNATSSAGAGGPRSKPNASTSSSTN